MCMSTDEIEVGLAQGKFASELSKEAWTRKLKLAIEEDCCDMDDLDSEIGFNTEDACALCHSYYDDNTQSCPDCPLVAIGEGCGSSTSAYEMLYKRFDEDFVPAIRHMIEVLDKAVEYEKGNHNGLESNLVRTYGQSSSN